MIGQTEIKEKLNKISDLYYLPKSIIISGEKGSGRHTVLNMICDKFLFEPEYIDYELSLSVLNDMYNISIGKLYVIDFDKLGENKRLDRFQNTLLKFIEEPPELAWIVLIVQDTTQLLETVINRCIEYRLSNYSLNELREIASANEKSFSDDELLLLKTPYNIINKSVEDIENTEKLIYNIIDNIHKANVSNTLSIRSKFESEIDIDLFINFMLDALCKKHSTSGDKKYFEAYILTESFKKNLNVLSINKNNLIDNYLMCLKELLTNGNNYI